MDRKEKIEELKMLSKIASLVATIPARLTINYASASANEKKSYRLEAKGLYYKIKYDMTGNTEYRDKMNNTLAEMHEAGRIKTKKDR